MYKRQSEKSEGQGIQLLLFDEAENTSEGKGIKYADEVIRRKVGKTGKK